MKDFGTYALILVLAMPALAAESEEDELMDVADSWQVFFDREGVAGTRQMSWRWHDPIDAGPVFTLGAAWDGSPASYPTVLGERGNFLLYYRGRDEQDDTIAVTRVARSKDGIRWTPAKPRLRGTGGTGKLPGQFAPFVDLKPGIPPGQRFKAVAALPLGGLQFFASPDGLRWKAMDVPPAFSGIGPEVHSAAYWSPREGAYVLYLGDQVSSAGDTDHWVSRSTSTNLRDWTSPEEIELEETRYMKRASLNPITPYPRAPGHLLTFAGRSVQGSPITKEDAERMKIDPDLLASSTDTILLASRDGVTFRDPSPRVLVRPGPEPGNWAARSNYVARNILMTSPREMSFYVVKRYGQPDCSLNRYTLRTDGFVSASPGPLGGRIITEPFELNGNTLRVNYTCSAGGWVKVGVWTTRKVPQKGYTVEDFRVLRGDSVNARCHWKRGAELEAKRGQVIRLMFDMCEADLYGWKIEDDPVRTGEVP